MPEKPEFSFHVHKLMCSTRRPALFTIAVWKGTVLRGICYAQSLDDALAAFCRVLEECGKQPTGEEVCLHSGVR